MDSATKTPLPELIVHIGAGKTGSTSIQFTLKRNAEALAAHKTAYVGLMLEHIPGASAYPWCVEGEPHRFFQAQDPARADREVYEVLRAELDRRAAAGIRQVIWSNEAFLSRADRALGIVRALKDDGVRIRLICYVRRHDKWARSAYTQFGIRHKGYSGELRNFRQWAERARPAFAADIETWRSAFPDTFELFNFDAAGDVTTHFLAQVGLDGIEPVRANASPSNALLAAWAAFNGQHDKPVHADTFARLVWPLGITSPKYRVVPPIDELLPDKADLIAIQDACRGDFERLNTLLAEAGEPPLQFDEPDAGRRAADSWEIDQLLLKMIYSLQRQLNDLVTTQKNQAQAPEGIGTGPVPIRPTPSSGDPNTMDERDLEAEVAELFQNVLLRPPSAAETAAWTQRARKLNQSFHEIFRKIVETPEFKQKTRVVPRYPSGHYYSPIVDPDEVRAMFMAAEKPAPEDLPGLDITEADLRTTFEALKPHVGTCVFPVQKSDDFRYFNDNGSYPVGDAVILSAMIGLSQPKRIIEIGSGYSTVCMLDTIERLGLDTTIKCVEPYPDRLLSNMRPEDHDRLSLVEDKVQNTDPELYAELEAGDILFIDSTHVLKTGSDVCFELFEVLPRLQPGVLVHFHDIQYPFEYPAKWVFEKRRSWNEIYAVRAFLMYNARFKVIFFNHFFNKKYREELEQSYRAPVPNSGGGLWLQVTGD